jgi:hypothetical protein
VLGDTRPLRIWGWLVAGVILVEALLHTPLGDRIPESGKWGNDRLARIVAGAEDFRGGGPADILFFGSSQGATWVDETDLRARGLRTFNASVPGGNTVLADLLEVRRLLAVRLMTRHRAAILGHVAATGTTVLTADAQVHPRFDAAVDQLSVRFGAPPSAELLAVPVFDALRNVTAVLQCAGRTRGKAVVVV